MKNAIIFGAGGTGSLIYKLVKNDYNIVCFADNNAEKIVIKEDKAVVCADSLLKYDYDCIIIASLTGIHDITEQLVRDFKIPREKIISKYCEQMLLSRVTFLSDFSKIVYDKNIQGSVAEVGVYRGEFAKYINRMFCDRKIFLYDTFDGFDIRDISYEHNNKLSNENVAHLNNTTVEIVLDKMHYKENCTIKKGYFPETFEEFEEKFCFVNLDTDLYNPILSGLEHFYPLMSKGGVICIHDYFNSAYLGVKKAVDEFTGNNNLSIFPIGDGFSVAIIK